jgi:hypothetical protein
MNKKNICFIGNCTGGAMAVLKRKYPKAWRALGAAQMAKHRAFCASREDYLKHPSRKAEGTPEQMQAVRAEQQQSAGKIEKQFQHAISQI